MDNYRSAFELNPWRLRKELAHIGICPLSIKVCDYGNAWAVRTEHGTVSLPISMPYDSVELEHLFYCANCHHSVTHGSLFSLRFALRVPWTKWFLEVAICKTCADMPDNELEHAIRDSLLLRRHWDTWASRIEAEIGAKAKSCEC